MLKHAHHHHDSHAGHSRYHVYMQYLGLTSPQPEGHAVHVQQVPSVGLAVVPLSAQWRETAREGLGKIQLFPKGSLGWKC